MTSVPARRPLSVVAVGLGLACGTADDDVRPSRARKFTCHQAAPADYILTAELGTAKALGLEPPD